MFIKKIAADEIADALEENLKIAYDYDTRAIENNRNSVVNYLTLASEILDEIGLDKAASSVTRVLVKIAESDPSIPESSDEAVKNLEEKGWMFNADDDNSYLDGLPESKRGEGLTYTQAIGRTADMFFQGKSRDEIRDFLVNQVGLKEDQAYFVYLAAKGLDKTRDELEKMPPEDPGDFY